MAIGFGYINVMEVFLIMIGRLFSKVSLTFCTFVPVIAVFTVLVVTSCTQETRQVVSERLAVPSFMVDRVIHTNKFDLLAWERMHERNADATIYIEGESHIARGVPSSFSSATPFQPVALAMASADKTKNVAWIGRPCQYLQQDMGEFACNVKYVNEARFAPEVIESYDQAIDNIKAVYGIRKIHLVGHGGGAAIAALVAAERNDILTFRSVAGILDHEAWTHYQEMYPLEESINPIIVAPLISAIPQHHFIGGQDKLVPPVLLHRWVQNSGDSPCIRYSIIAENSNRFGWQEKWPELLNRPVDCKTEPYMQNNYVSDIPFENVTGYPEEAVESKRYEIYEDSMPVRRVKPKPVRESKEKSSKYENVLYQSPLDADSENYERKIGTIDLPKPIKEGNDKKVREKEKSEQEIGDVIDNLTGFDSSDKKSVSDEAVYSKAKNDNLSGSSRPALKNPNEPLSIQSNDFNNIKPEEQNK